MKPIIDNEFRTLIPSLTKEEFLQLEANCLENGIQDSIKTWNGIVIDGHNRYEIAKKHRLEFKTEEMEFESRDDVRFWIIKNQLGRRNLSAYDRSVLALKLKPMIAEKAKENQKASGGAVPQKSAKPIDTRQELAKVAGVSHDTIHKVETIEKSGNEEVKQAIRNKEMSIDKAYREVKGVPKKVTVPIEVKEPEETVVTIPVEFVEQEEQKVKITFVEEECAEDVEDSVADTKNTFANHIAAEFNSSMVTIINTTKFSGVNVVDEIRDISNPGFSKEDFKSRIHECIKILVRLENGLANW